MKCNRCNHDNPNAHKFCSECGTSLLQASREAERRSLTVMFCDLADSTSLSERVDPEELQHIITTYQDCCRQVIKRFDGFIAKYMGDGILVYFGYPSAHEDDAQRAVRAALEISDAVQKLVIGPDRAIAVRTGIATGSVVIGDIIGEGTAEEVSVLGLTPNLAARLQSVAGRNETVISDATHHRLGGLFKLNNLGFLSLKGIAAATQVWRVEELRITPHRRTSKIPFVGREDSLSVLTSALEKSRQKSLEIVHITGLPGIGKTRLVNEFLSMTDDCEILIWTCSAFHRHVPFHPIPGELHRIKSNISTAEGAAQRQVIFDTISSSIIKKSKSVPLVLIVEDLHWIDPTTADYLMAIRKRVSGHSILLITVSRPGEPSEQLASAMGGDVLSLGPIKEEDARSLIDKIVSNDVSEELRSKIIQRASGLPLYLEELVNVVLTGETDDIPDSLQELLLARLDGLGPAKRIAQLASVFGSSFSYSDLLEMEEFQGVDIAPLFNKILAEGLFVATPNGYSFRHALMQEVSYETLLLRTRRKLHNEIADHLVQSSVDRTPDVIARHLSGAERYKDAAHYWRKAALMSAKLWSHEEAAAYYEKALQHAIVIADDKSVLSTRFEFVESLRVIDRYDDALEQLNLAELLANEVGSDEDWLRLHVLRGNILFPLGEADLCIQSQKLALLVAKKLNFPEAQARALSGMGDAYFASKRVFTAEKNFDVCVKLSIENDLDNVTLSNISMRGHMRLYLGKIKKAEADCNRAVRMSVDLGNRRAEMTAVGSCLGKVLFEKGTFIEADEAFSHASTIAAELGAHRFEALNILFRGKVALERQERTEAMTYGRRAVEIARVSGPKFCLPMAIGVVARAEGSREACLEALAEGEAVIANGCLAHNQLWFYRDAALAMIQHGLPDEARHYANLLTDTFAIEPLPWCILVAEGIEALAQLLEKDDNTAANAVILKAEKKGFNGWAHTLSMNSSPRSN